MGLEGSCSALILSLLTYLFDSDIYWPLLWVFIPLNYGYMGGKGCKVKLESNFRVLRYVLSGGICLAVSYPFSVHTFNFVLCVFCWCFT